jgi:hypothetical protein
MIEIRFLPSDALRNLPFPIEGVHTITVCVRFCIMPIDSKAQKYRPESSFSRSSKDQQAFREIDRGVQLARSLVCE